MRTELVEVKLPDRSVVFKLFMHEYKTHQNFKEVTQDFGR